jgi:hypothetical protein
VKPRFHACKISLIDIGREGEEGIESVPRRERGVGNHAIGALGQGADYSQARLGLPEHVAVKIETPAHSSTNARERRSNVVFDLR